MYLRLRFAEIKIWKIYFSVHQFSELLVNFFKEFNFDKFQIYKLLVSLTEIVIVYVWLEWCL